MQYWLGTEVRPGCGPWIGGRCSSATAVVGVAVGVDCAGPVGGAVDSLEAWGGISSSLVRTAVLGGRRREPEGSWAECSEASLR